MNNVTKSTARKPDIPEEIRARWQRIVDLMARVFKVPAGLIMRVAPPQIEVFLSSATEGNPYYKGERADLNTGLYCETVMEKKVPLLVPDALKDPVWDHNPDINVGMTFYLGYPLIWPDGEIFGTICVLDKAENPETTQFRDLISELQQVVEKDLRILIEAHEREVLLAQLQQHRDHLQEMVAEQTSSCLKRERDLAEAQRVAHVGSWEWDIVGDTQHWSDEFYRIFGLLPQGGGATYEAFLAFVHPDDRQAVDEANQESISDLDKPYSIEYRVVRPDGTERLVSARGEVVFDQNQRPLRMIGTLQDITAQKEAERAARTDQIRLGMALEAAGMVTWEWDIGTGSIRYSDNIGDIVRGSAIGPYCSLDALMPQVHPEDREKLTQALDQTAKQGNPFECEYRVHMVDGTYRWILGRGKRVILESGKPVRVLGLSIDITERRQAEEALAAVHRQIQSIIDNTPAIVYAFDLEERFVMANTTVAALLNSTPAQMIGKRRHEFMPEGDADWHEANDREVIDTGRALEFEEYSQLKGRSITWLTTKFPLRDLQGRIYAVAGISADITERKRAEEALQQRTRELQHLTETLEEHVAERTAELAELSSRLVTAQENERKRVSYELHDNVWQMLLTIRLEIDRLFSGQEDWKALRNKSKQVMTNIVNLVGKIRSMQGDLWPYVLDDIGMAATIDWYCREFERNHSGLTMEIRNEVADGEIPPSAKIVMYRILQEALENAAKHSQCSRVTLRLMKNDHRIEFTVDDNGIGFDPQEAISKKAPWGGFGLLNIRARTELSGGTFGVESTKGQGTSIRASWLLSGNN